MPMPARTHSAVALTPLIFSIIFHSPLLGRRVIGHRKSLGLSQTSRGRAGLWLSNQGASHRLWSRMPSGRPSQSQRFIAPKMEPQ
jgi:hypothetical protein